MNNINEHYNQLMEIYIRITEKNENPLEVTKEPKYSLMVEKMGGQVSVLDYICIQKEFFAKANNNL